MKKASPSKGYNERDERQELSLRSSVESLSTLDSPTRPLPDRQAGCSFPRGEGVEGAREREKRHAVGIGPTVLVQGLLTQKEQDR